MKLVIVPPCKKYGIRCLLLDDQEMVVELVSHYLNTLALSGQGYSPKTIVLYGNNLRYLCEWLASDSLYGKLPMDHVLSIIPRGVISQYLSRLRQAGKEETTLKNRDLTYKGFFEWLTTSEAEAVRSSSGYENGLIIKKASSRNVPRFVTKEQMIILLGAVYHESQRCALHFIYDAGLRVSEIGRVLKEDIDALDQWPTELAYLPLLIRGSKGRGGRGGCRS